MCFDPSATPCDVRICAAVGGQADISRVTASASPVGHVYLKGAKVGKVMWGDLHRAVQGPSIGSQTPDGSRGHYGSGSSYNVSFA